MTLGVSDILGVTLALAPSVKLGVAEFESDALREAVDEGVKDDVPVLEPVGVLVGVPLAVSLAVTLGVSDILGVPLALAPSVKLGVAEFDNDELREDVDDGVDDDVPVLEEVPEPELVCVAVGGGVELADKELVDE